MLVKPGTCVGAKGREPIQSHTAVGHTMVSQRICRMTCHCLCPCQVMLFAKEATWLWGGGGLVLILRQNQARSSPPLPSLLESLPEVCSLAGQSASPKSGICQDGFCGLRLKGTGLQSAGAPALTSSTAEELDGAKKKMELDFSEPRKAESQTTERRAWGPFSLK